MPEASTPTTLIQDGFRRIAQQGRHDDVLACIAILGGKTLESVFHRAETFGLPKLGPYYNYLDGDMIAKLLASEGLVASVWKESVNFKDLPDVAIAMVDYDEEWEAGRCVVFHRMKLEDSKAVQPYVVDPYPHADNKLHVRVGIANLAPLVPRWYIGVTQMKKPTAK